MESVRTIPCDQARALLCRLATGARLDDRGLTLARHVRACSPCSEYVDELASLRRWLAHASPRAPADREDDELLRAARVALVRELEARLARDLHARCTGRSGRERADVLADLRRARALRDASSLSPADWHSLCSLLRGACGKAQAGVALALAARLDPLGLDLGLAWLGQLARDGELERAEREADRYLARIENSQMTW